MININEVIEMAWSDDVTFSDIEREVGIKEPEVKRIMQATSSLALISFGEKGFAGSRKRRKHLIISFELAEWFCLTYSS